MTGKESENIRDDLCCIRCDYNLKTLERSNRCPECGLPIAKSLDENTRFSRLEKTITLCALITGIAPLLCLYFIRLSMAWITSLLAYSILLNVGLGFLILILRSARIGRRIRLKLLLIAVAAGGFSVLNALALVRVVVRAAADV